MPVVLASSVVWCTRVAPISCFRLRPCPNQEENKGTSGTNSVA
jgi:hypothetical protein